MVGTRDKLPVFDRGDVVVAVNWLSPLVGEWIDRMRHYHRVGVNYLFFKKLGICSIFTIILNWFYYTRLDKFILVWQVRRQHAFARRHCPDGSSWRLARQQRHLRPGKQGRAVRAQGRTQHAIISNKN